MRLLVLTDWLAPYRIDLFNELAKRVDITVFYMDTTSFERNDSWRSEFSSACKYHQMRSIKVPVVGKISSDFSKEYNRNCDMYDAVIFDGYGSYNLVNGIHYVAKKKKLYFVNIDGALIRQEENRVISLVKRRILGKGGYFLCGSTVSNAYLLHYGVPIDHVFNHRFTSLYQNDILSYPITEEHKLQIRQVAGMTERFIILSVGRFSYKRGYGKGYDAILRAAARMPKEYGFYIVGDEPTEEFIHMRDKLGASNVHFVGFMQKEELKLYYQAANLLVLMTVYDVWGLVINEAMANGLPVITTDKCVAGLELVHNGENGFIIQVGDDRSLENQILEVLADETRRKIMAQNSLEVIRAYTIENVAEEHIRVFTEVLSARK